jgi:UDPglucose 6-dehydrogenase
VVSNPEFLREGFAVKDSMNPSRVVVGSSSEKARLWQKSTNHLPIQVFLLFLWTKNSELTKYAANSF